MIAYFRRGNLFDFVFDLEEKHKLMWCDQMHFYLGCDFFSPEADTGAECSLLRRLIFLCVSYTCLKFLYPRIRFVKT